MKILAIDTSSAKMIVLLYKDGETFVYQNDCQKQHSETLNPAVEELCRKAEVALQDVDVFACCVGPGSFTGIRVGIAAMKGFRTVFGKKAISVNSLEVAAYHTKGCVTAYAEAGRGNFYAAVFEDGVCVKQPFLATSDESSEQKLYCGNGNTPENLLGTVLQKIERNEFSQDWEPLYLQKSQAEVMHERRQTE